MNYRKQLVVIYLIAFLQNFAFAGSVGILPVYLKILGASGLIVGSSFAVFSFTRGAVSLFAGQMADNLSKKSLLIYSLIGFSLSNLAYIWSTTPVHLVIARVLQGVAAGLYWVIIFALVSDLGREDDKLRNLTLLNVSMSISGVLASWIGGYMAERISPQFVFLQGFVAFSLAALTTLRLDLNGSDQRENANPFNIRSIFNVAYPARKTSILASLSMVCEITTPLSMTLYVTSVGGTYTDVGMIAGLAVACGIVAQLAAPYLRKRFAYQSILRMIYLINALLVLGIVSVGSLRIAYLLFPIVGGLFSLSVLSWLALTQSLADQDKMGLAVGFFRGITDLTSMLYFLGFGALYSKFSVKPVLAFSAAIMLGVVVLINSIGRVDRCTITLTPSPTTADAADD